MARGRGRGRPSREMARGRGRRPNPRDPNPRDPDAQVWIKTNICTVFYLTYFLQNFQSADFVGFDHKNAADVRSFDYKLFNYSHLNCRYFFGTFFDI